MKEGDEVTFHVTVTQEGKRRVGGSLIHELKGRFGSWFNKTVKIIREAEIEFQVEGLTSESTGGYLMW